MTDRQPQQEQGLVDNRSGNVEGAYEDIRDSTTGQAGSAWVNADKQEQQLLAYYDQLHNDDRYVEEHKSRLAWAKYDEMEEKINTAKARTKDLLLENAKAYRRQAIPTPDGAGLMTKDTDKLLLGQNERARIVSKLDRLDRSATGPMKPNHGALMREEYGRGMDLGGREGMEKNRGVIQAADELGIPLDSNDDG